MMSGRSQQGQGIPASDLPDPGSGVPGAGSVGELPSHLRNRCPELALDPQTDPHPKPLSCPLRAAALMATAIAAGFLTGAQSTGGKSSDQDAVVPYSDHES
jgi:hypothetical protein